MPYCFWLRVISYFNGATGQAGFCSFQAPGRSGCLSLPGSQTSPLAMCLKPVSPSKTTLVSTISQVDGPEKLFKMPRCFSPARWHTKRGGKLRETQTNLVGRSRNHHVLNPKLNPNSGGSLELVELVTHLSCQFHWLKMVLLEIGRTLGFVE